MFLDFIHALFKWIHSNPRTVFNQIVLRNYMSIFVLNDPNFQTGFYTKLMIFAWSASEVTRYSQYLFQTKFTKFLRYKLFPLWFFIGIFMGEIPTLYMHIRATKFVGDMVVIIYFFLTVPGIFISLINRSKKWRIIYIIWLYFNFSLRTWQKHLKNYRLRYGACARRFNSWITLLQIIRQLFL